MSAYLHQRFFFYSLQTYGLPQVRRTSPNTLPTGIIQETSYDANALERYVNENAPKFLQNQQLAYNTIFGSIRLWKGGLSYLDAPGGAGETFVTKLPLALVGQKKGITLAMEPSRIAANRW